MLFNELVKNDKILLFHGPIVVYHFFYALEYVFKNYSALKKVHGANFNKNIMMKYQL